MDILAILAEKNIAYEMRGADEVAIICPNQAAHSDGMDSLPSFNINLIKEVGHCFACGWSLNQVGMIKWLIGGELDEMMLQSMSIRGRLKRLQQEKPEGLFMEEAEFQTLMPPGKPFPYQYRGMQLETYRLLKAIECQTGRYENRICFPITQHGKLMGVDARALGDAKPKYIRPKGCDAQRWLYPFDLAKAAKIKRAILCEGMFHSVNYLDKMGIPEALCYFGSNNWHEHKLMLLLELGVDYVVFFPDNDKAGLKARDEICPQIAPWITTYTVPTACIPEDCDLGDMTKDEIENALKNKVRWK